MFMFVFTMDPESEIKNIHICDLPSYFSPFLFNIFYDNLHHTLYLETSKDTQP